MVSILELIIDYWIGLGDQWQRFCLTMTALAFVFFLLLNERKVLTKQKAKEREMNIIWYSIYINLAILIFLVAMFPFENKVAWITLELMWYLSFGWICARVTGFEETKTFIKVEKNK